MSELFSEKWMSDLKDAWNNEEAVYGPLEKANFNANIGYGFKGESNPRGLIIISNGKIVRAGDYIDENLDWDLRASPQNWLLWLKEGFGLGRLGPAVAMRKLQFAVGDYRQMIRNPKLSHPFIIHFELMTKIPTTV